MAQHSRRAQWRFLSLIVAVAHAAPLSSQVGTPALTPEIVTTGSNSVALPADRALVRIGVATRAATASAASAPNGPAVARVQDTLRILGYVGRAARVTSFGVVPNYDFQGGRRLIDYEARTTLEVTVSDIPALGKLLDAVLAVGATDIGSIVFESDSSGVTRRRALAAALAEARQDAEALARAAGGQLGPLRLATTSPEAGIPMRSAASVEAYAMSGGLAGVATFRRDVVVSVGVQARWVFVPRP